MLRIIFVSYMIMVFCLNIFNNTALAQEKKAVPRKVIITDALGNSVEVPSPPKRIIALFPFAAEIISALGDKNLIVGRSMNCVFPEEILNRPNLGSPIEPDLEKLLELKPDVVVCCGMHSKKELRDKIRSFGIPVIAFEYNRFEHILSAIESIGVMLDKKEKAKELTDWINYYLKKVLERTKKIKQDKKVKVYVEHGAGVYKSVSKLYGFNDLIEWAGGINIACDHSVPLPIVNAEWVLEQNPDFIVVYGHPPAVRVDIIPTKEHLSFYVQEILRRPELQNLKAIKEKKVCLLHVRIITGPRMVVGLCYLAKWFYPSLFKDLDPDKVNEEFYRKFWNSKPEGELVFPPCE